MVEQDDTRKSKFWVAHNPEATSLISQLFSFSISQPNQPTNQIHSICYLILLLLLLLLLSTLFSSSFPTTNPGGYAKGQSRTFCIAGNKMCSPDNPNWVFDYGLIEDLPVPGSDLPPLEPPAFTWPSHSFTAPTALSVDFNDSYGNSDGLNETGSRKRVRPESCGSSGSKACREKMRRDRLNDRFLELGSILDPGRPPKMDKAVILGDAVRMVTQLRREAKKLKESNEDLQEKINELKAEKNELRDEKQRLKAEKDSLDQKVKALSIQPSFLHPSALAAPYSGPGHVVGSKLVPLGYPGISMWQFMPPAAVDTSQDHVLRPPVA